MTNVTVTLRSASRVHISEANNPKGTPMSDTNLVPTSIGLTGLAMGIFLPEVAVALAADLLGRDYKYSQRTAFILANISHGFYGENERTLLERSLADDSAEQAAREGVTA